MYRQAAHLGSVLSWGAVYHLADSVSQHKPMRIGSTYHQIRRDNSQAVLENETLIMNSLKYPILELCEDRPLCSRTRSGFLESLCVCGVGISGYGCKRGRGGRWRVVVVRSLLLDGHLAAVSLGPPDPFLPVDPGCLCPNCPMRRVPPHAPPKHPARDEEDALRVASQLYLFECPRRGSFQAPVLVVLARCESLRSARLLASKLVKIALLCRWRIETEKWRIAVRVLRGRMEAKE